MVSSSHTVSAAPCPSGGGLLTLCPCSSVGSLPWRQNSMKCSKVSPSHGLQLFTNCPSVGPSHGCGPSGTACSSMGPPRDHSFLQASTCSSVGSLPWATGGPPWTAGGQPASPWSSSRAAREDSLLQRLKHLLRPPSSLTLVSAELFLSHRLTPLSQLLSPHSFFLPFLKYVIPEVLPPSLIALASGGSVSEPAGIGFIRHGGSFSQLLTETTPVGPRLPKPCHANP